MGPLRRKMIHSKTKNRVHVNAAAASAKMPIVQQAAFHKYRLLLKLLFSRPSEFYDRVKTKAEGMVSPPQPPATSTGLGLGGMLDLCSKHLVVALYGFH